MCLQFDRRDTLLKNKSLADAKVSARQQCLHEGPSLDREKSTCLLYTSDAADE